MPRPAASRVGLGATVIVALVIAVVGGRSGAHSALAAKVRIVDRTLR